MEWAILLAAGFIMLVVRVLESPDGDAAAGQDDSAGGPTPPAVGQGAPEESLAAARAAARAAEKPRGKPVRDGLALDWIILYGGGTLLGERRIIVEAIYGRRGPMKLFAWCMRQRAYRTFMVDAILEARETKTGRVVPVDYRLLDWIDGLWEPPETGETPIAPCEMDVLLRNGDRFEFTANSVHVWWDARGIEGRARRPRTAERRAWSGKKTVLECDLAEAVLRETGEVFEAPDFAGLFEYLESRRPEAAAGGPAASDDQAASSFSIR